jgi:hypothetical protein
MNLSKIRRQHVIILGSVVSVIFAVGLFYLLIKPVNEQMKVVSDQLQASEAVASKLGSDRRALDDALKQVAGVESKLTGYENAKMPNLSFSQRDKGMIDLWNEQIDVLGPLLTQWASRGRVMLTSELKVPAPPTNPNEISTDLITIPIGKMAVVGDFKSIMDHIRGWNVCPRLVRIDKPSLAGMSPMLAASYDMTVYIFPRGTAGPQIQIAGSPGASSSGGSGGSTSTRATYTSSPSSSTGGGGSRASDLSKEGT